MTKDEEKKLARVEPSVPCVAPAGSTAEQLPGAVIAAERTEHDKLLADHSVALEFVREVAALSLLVADHDREYDLIRRARAWLHTASERAE